MTGMEIAIVVICCLFVVVLLVAVIAKASMMSKQNRRIREQAEKKADGGNCVLDIVQNGKVVRVECSAIADGIDSAEGNKKEA